LRDEISQRIFEVIQNSDAPLETKEVCERIKTEINDATRSKIMYRLTLLRGDGDIHGKSVGSGKGVWIWWKANNINSSSL